LLLQQYRVMKTRCSTLISLVNPSTNKGTGAIRGEDKYPSAQVVKILGYVYAHGCARGVRKME